MSALQLEIIQELESLLGDQFIELLQVFKDESSVLREAIVAAVSQSERDDVRIHAHSLKGASSNLGAMDLRRCCERIEQEALAAPIGELEILCEELAFCHQAVLDELSLRLRVA